MDKMYDLTLLPLPKAEDLNNLPISIESSSNYITVKLKDNAPAKESIHDSTQNDQNIPDNEIDITSPPKRPRYTIRDTYNSETNRVTMNFERFTVSYAGPPIPRRPPGPQGPHLPGLQGPPIVNPPAAPDGNFPPPPDGNPPDGNPPPPPPGRAPSSRSRARGGAG